MINYYERAKAQPEIFKQFTYKELLFVNYDCPLVLTKLDNWSQHNYFLYVVTGKKGFHTPDRSWLLTEGKAAFIKRGACIIEKFFDEILCLIAFFVPDDYLRSFLRENISLVSRKDLPVVTNELIIELEVTDVMTAYYRSVIPYFSSDVKPPEELLELKFRELLINIITNPANNALNAYLQTLMQTNSDNLQQIVEANCYYNLPLEAYAKLCNRSLSSFKRDFYKAYKNSPSYWLQEKRLLYAQKLLLTTDKPVSDISFESGFENSTHFSKVFKKRFGAAPLQYRKQKIASHFS
jgi:AraC-like DNA-binding protein